MKHKFMSSVIKAVTAAPVIALSTPMVVTATLDKLV